MPFSPPFIPGERYISESEPELGLGVVFAVEPRVIELLFPVPNVSRRYSINNAPLHRVLFKKGDLLLNQEGERLTVADTRRNNETGLYEYQCGRKWLSEALVSGASAVFTPLERLLHGKRDKQKDFELRLQCLRYREYVRRSAVRGFHGGRIDLLPHQLFIAHTVISRHSIRVMLADETGLGKTVEACLILHRLMITGRINRVLVLVPEHLIHQWFVELLRRFNLSFSIFSSSHECPENENPFLKEPCFIAGFPALTQHDPFSQATLQADWDLVIVDEAHHAGKEEHAYSFLSGLSARVKHLLLLTATPEQHGRKTHFALLHLLDPLRYPRFDHFENENSTLHEILQSAERQLHQSRVDLKLTTPDQIEVTIPDPQDANIRKKINLGLLLDVYGVGRIMFRNTRQYIAGFPKRLVHPVSLLGDQDLSAYIDWFLTLSKEQETEKFLLICSSKEKAVAFQAAVERKARLDIALFHEEMTILQRDRQAAWFANKEGARFLVSSEIGSEGRNFQFCRNLILLDLPMQPELLEQRIGRLDRIGQGPVIHIYIPFRPGTAQELLCRWYHEGLDALAHHVPAAGRVFEQVRNELEMLLDSPIIEKKGIDSLMEKTRLLCMRISNEVTAPRDRLFEWTSFQPTSSNAMIEAIQDKRLRRTTEVVMEKLLEAYGIEMEEIGQGRYLLRSDYMVDPHFPLPRSSEPVLTFDRSVALIREDIEFITPDHPMLSGALDLFLSKEKGNCAFCTWKEGRRQEILLELIYVVECMAPPDLDCNRFLPPTPVRLVIDKEGYERSREFPSERLQTECRDMPNPDILKHSPTLKLIKNIFEQSEHLVHQEKEKLIALSSDAVDRYTKQEKARLHELALKGIADTLKENEALLGESHFLKQKIAEAGVRLDSIRFILPRKPEIPEPETEADADEKCQINEDDAN